MQYNIKNMNIYNKNNKFNLIEIKTLLGLSSIFFLRMLGMFMLLPVLNHHPLLNENSNTLLLGLFIGSYGLCQAFFQIPFGMISDYLGRKTVIILGLILLSIGSIFAAIAQSILFLIIGRSIQGSGAITSTSMALLSDIFAEKKRNKATAIIGITFSISFAISIIISPIITDTLGLNFIFWIIFIFSLISILIAIFFLPDTKKYKTQKIDLNSLKRKFFKVVKNKQLKKINFCIMFLHITLMTNFISLPSLFENLGYQLKNHWKIYFYIILFSFIFMMLIINILKKTNYPKNKALIIFICIICFSEIIFVIGNTLNNFWILILGLQLYFISFYLLETILPNFISTEFKTNSRGTAMGLYSSTQFLGIAIGGLIGGFLYNINVSCVFLFNFLLSIVWFFISLKIKNN